MYGLPAGLVEHEAEILQRLIRGHQMTPQALADALALPIDDVRLALERPIAQTTHR